MLSSIESSGCKCKLRLLNQNKVYTFHSRIARFQASKHVMVTLRAFIRPSLDFRLWEQQVFQTYMCKVCQYTVSTTSWTRLSPCILRPRFRVPPCAITSLNAVSHCLTQVIANKVQTSRNWWHKANVLGSFNILPEYRLLHYVPFIGHL